MFALVALRHWIAVTFNSAISRPVDRADFVVIALPLHRRSAFCLQSRKPKANPALDMALLAGPPVLRFASRRLSPRTVAVGVVLVAGLVARAAR